MSRQLNGIPISLEASPASQVNWYVPGGRRESGRFLGSSLQRHPIKVYSRVTAALELERERLNLYFRTKRSCDVLIQET